jgi:hypothetical protein
MQKSLKDIPEAWGAYQHAAEGSPARAHNEWAADAFADLLVADPVSAWHVVESTFEQFQHDSWIVENLGAGPVETLLRMHEDQVLPLLAVYVESNPKFDALLRHVWWESVGLKAKKFLEKQLSAEPRSS